MKHALFMGYVVTAFKYKFYILFYGLTENVFSNRIKEILFLVLNTRLESKPDLFD